MTDQIKRGELCVEYCPTEETRGDFFTKPLQGSKFRKFRKVVLNLPDDVPKSNKVASQECVGTARSYADVVRGTKERAHGSPVKNDATASIKKVSFSKR